VGISAVEPLLNVKQVAGTPLGAKLQGFIPAFEVLQLKLKQKENYDCIENIT
jgi:hypothetical protein